jgi:hypothetical protein
MVQPTVRSAVRHHRTDRTIDHGGVSSNLHISLERYFKSITFALSALKPIYSDTMSLSSSRSRVLAGYRGLFRARKSLFLGDVEAMRESRKAIKTEFEKNRTSPAEGPQFEGLLSMIDEAEDMMRQIVRGNLNAQTGNYGMYFRSFVRRSP